MSARSVSAALSEVIQDSYACWVLSDTVRQAGVCERAASGDPDAIDCLWGAYREALERDVASVAGSTSLPEGELRALARSGLMRAAEFYSSRSRIPFPVFAHFWVVQMMMRVAEQHPLTPTG